jgi:hypothetical protein
VLGSPTSRASRRSRAQFSPPIRRGFLWASDEAWEDIFQSIEALETHDVALRAKLAAKRREYARIKRQRDASDLRR